MKLAVARHCHRDTRCSRRSGPSRAQREREREREKEKERERDTYTHKRDGVVVGIAVFEGVATKESFSFFLFSSSSSRN
jgi:hypothetical protein